MSRFDHLFYLTSRLHARTDRFIQTRLNQHGLKGLVPSHGAILSLLYQRGPMTMAALAEAIDRDRSTVTALVEKLVRSGYVARDPDPDDRRKTRVVLTEASRPLKKPLLAISSELRRTAFRDLDPEMLHRVMGVLERLIQNLDDEHVAADERSARSTRNRKR
ncbi:MarR family transcriptional regulator [Sulfidibacter corallicola]|uniref:MarR family transcriptional regulator n=1 Tax=Sulfidibacter corallicola TaxID=2818388 RepID=A0A8A4TMQ8_SULCO|nr:MarR family transcriptional regulator [Sulfidibacter corallicola]QTD51269.1 MarR family transcriptional regulator [Sulfidibacter corallicola]